MASKISDNVLAKLIEEIRMFTAQYDWKPAQSRSSDFDMLVRLLADAGDLVSAARELQSAANSAVTKSLDGIKDVIEVEGIGTVQRVTNATKTEFDRDLVMSKIAKLAKEHREFNKETGEIEDPADAYARILDDFLLKGKFRVDGFKKWNIPVDRYRRQTYGGYKTILQRTQGDNNDGRSHRQSD